MSRRILGGVVPLMLLSAVVACGGEIKLASLDWEPYIGKKVEGNGYVAEIVRAAFKAKGYSAKIDFLPWARAVSESKNGSYDGLFPEYYDEARKDDYVFSDPFPGGPLVFMKRKGKEIPYTGNLDELKPYKIGVVRGYINTKAFDARTDLKKEETGSDEMNLKKLVAGRVDLIVIDRLVAEHLIATSVTQGKGKIEAVEPVMEVKPLYIAFSKKAPAYEKKMADFNDGLKAIKEDGSLQKILEKHGVAEALKVSRAVVPAETVAAGEGGPLHR